MKRLMPWGLSALVWVAPARAQAPTVIVAVGGELSEPVSSEFFAPVFADMRSAAGARLGSYTVRLNWDPAVLQYVGVEAGPFALPVIQTDSAYYGVLVASAISALGQDGIVDLFRLKLRVIQAQTSALTIDVTEMSAAGTPFADLTGSVTKVNGSFCPAIGRWGDLDRDGFSNSRDALSILSSVVGLPVDPIFQLNLGDVNNDGRSNSVDALIILSYAVGIEIPGQRVLLAAPGPCGTGLVPSLVIVPDTADLVVGQKVRLKAQAKSPSGYTALAVGWDVVDPSVAVADKQGLLIGLGPGTTKVVAALGPGVQYSAPVVVRTRRQAWYVGGAEAKRASVQLGTRKWPFSTPQRAFPHVSEGDTIHVLPGVSDYEIYYEEGVDYADLTENLAVGVVIQGDTLSNGERPVLRGNSYYVYQGVNWTGGRHGELRNLVLRGFGFGAQLNGLKSLTVSNVRYEDPPTGYGYGLYVYSYTDTVIVQASTFVGDAAGGLGYGVYVLGGVGYLEVRGSQFARLSLGLYDDRQGRRQGPFVLTGNVVDSVDTGFDVNADSMLITDNVFTRVRSRAIWTWPAFSDRPFVTSAVVRNQVTCTGTGTFGIEVDYSPARIDSNTVNGCTYAIYGTNNFTYPLAAFQAVGNTVTANTAYYNVGIRPDGRWRATLTGNRVTGGYVGIDVTTTDSTVAAVIDSNVVSGAGQTGIQLWYVNGPVTGRKNNVVNSAQDGLYNAGTGSRSFTLGRFVGNARYGLYNGASGTFGAQQNWWGDPGGPGVNGSNPVTGNIDAANPLPQDPGDVPALAIIAAFRAMAPVPFVAAATAVRLAPPPAQTFEAARAAKRAAGAGQAREQELRRVRR